MSIAVTKDAVRRLVAEHYSLAGRLDELPGYSDRNFLLRTDEGERFVVKLAQGGRSSEDLALEHRAMARASAAGIPVPSVRDNRGGAGVTRVAAHDSVCLMRVLTYLPGTFLADVPAGTSAPALWSDLGALLGRLDSTLHDCTPPEGHESSEWDLARGDVVCRNALHLLDDERRGLVSDGLEHYRQNVMPHLGELPRSVIHNDANDHNILVDDAASPAKVTGLIDFGDLMLTHTVNEIAIASAYALMEQPDPVATLTYLVAAYHGERPLIDAEVAAIFGLVRLRLSTSICNAAVACSKRPDDEYLRVSVRPAIELLERLRGISPCAVESGLRRACGFPVDTGC